eukprot:SAG11_NODE_117_length_15962_cov_71.527925_6_plen_73_part_00
MGLHLILLGRVLDDVGSHVEHVCVNGLDGRFDKLHAVNAPVYGTNFNFFQPGYCCTVLNLIFSNPGTAVPRY